MTVHDFSYNQMDNIYSHLLWFSLYFLPLPYPAYLALTPCFIFDSAWTFLNMGIGLFVDVSLLLPLIYNETSSRFSCFLRSRKYSLLNTYYLRRMYMILC